MLPNCWVRGMQPLSLNSLSPSHNIGFVLQQRRDTTIIPKILSSSRMTSLGNNQEDEFSHREVGRAERWPNRELKSADPKVKKFHERNSQEPLAGFSWTQALERESHSVFRSSFSWNLPNATPRILRSAPETLRAFLTSWKSHQLPGDWRIANTDEIEKHVW